MYLDVLLERLNNPYLKNPNNQGRQVLDGTVCEYLEHYDNHILDLWLCVAKSDYLDVLGAVYGVIRKDEESDNDYRSRIQADISMVDSATDIRNAGAELYCKTTGDFGDKWTSDNLYLGNTAFWGHADTNTKDYLDRKFMIGDITWVVF